MLNSIKPWHIIAAAAVLALGTYAVWLKAPSVPTLNVYPVRTSSAGEVEISVQPDLAGSEWSFEMYLSTHVTELDDDMVQAAVLEIGERQYKPLKWEGDPPGGHHRSGRLLFRPATMSPAFALIVKGVADVEERRFEWTNE